MLWAKVTFDFEGVHFWEDAKKDVEFLRYPHRHVFKVVVWVEQLHNDRDVEYIQLKRALQDGVKGGGLDGKSCEMIAEEIAKALGLLCPGRKTKVEVLEDGENGALWEKE